MSASEESYGAAADVAAASSKAPFPGRPVAPRLYAIADGDVLGLEAFGPKVIMRAVESMADAGIRWIQLRLKSATDRARLEMAESCQRLLEGSESCLWIDDRPDIAALVGARGVHVGQADLSPPSTRRVVGTRTWIGLSCHDLEQVEAADRDPSVDVVAVGPVHATVSKAHPDPVIGLGGVSAARRRTSKPLVAIGGIDAERAPQVLEAGADSVVMLGALCRGDVAANARRLVALLECEDGDHGSEPGHLENPRLEMEK